MIDGPGIAWQQAGSGYRTVEVAIPTVGWRLVYLLSQAEAGRSTVLVITVALVLALATLGLAYVIYRRESRAEKVIGEIDRQIASGVPATADMWTAWGDKVKGTAYEGEMKQRLEEEAEVQKVLRLPVDHGQLA